jgi:hypothetical protein
MLNYIMKTDLLFRVITVQVVSLFRGDYTKICFAMLQNKQIIKGMSIT